jgi:ankyrin repeat protein
MVEMVSELISLARTEGGGERVKAVLGKLNKQGETALHEALRLRYKETVVAMVSRLMAADAELAQVPLADGTSPLYLAVLLGHDDIAQGLHEYDEGLSYSGPKGQNVLHAAVLRSACEFITSLPSNANLSSSHFLYYDVSIFRDASTRCPNKLTLRTV